MKTILLACLCLASHVYSFGQAKEFVCTPCGSDCDSKVHSKGGSCPSCGMALVEKLSVHFKDLSVEEVCERIAANPKLVLLDVRSPGEFTGGKNVRNSYGHFKDAININIDDLERRVGELSKYKDDEIIVYCSHSHRSPRATYFLASQGFTNVSNMAGGTSTLVGREKDECLKKTFVFHSSSRD